MQTKELTSKEYFNGLTVFHATLLIGQVLFGVVAFYLNSNVLVKEDMEDLNKIFQIVVPIFIISGLLGSKLLTKIRIKSIKEKTELKEKLGDYRVTLIIKFALLEGPSLFALVCYFLTANYFFLELAGLIIMAFLVNRPTRHKVVIDLELNHAERALIKDPRAIVA